MGIEAARAFNQVLTGRFLWALVGLTGVDCTRATSSGDARGSDAAGTTACMPGEWIVCTCDASAAGAAQCGADASFEACVCPAPSCVVGESRACHCPNGAGAQRCESPGYFASCVCEASDVDAADAPSNADACGTAGDACVPRTCNLCGAVPDGCGCWLDCGACVDGVQPLPFRVNHVIADIARHRYYATIAEGDLTWPNAIAVIDPNRPWAVTTVPVGSNPNAIALSDDGSTLWVGIDGQQSMRRVDIMGATDPVLVPAVMVPLGGAAFSLVIMRGTTRSVAAAIHSTFSTGMVATSIFDDGVARPNSLTYTTYVESLTRGDDAHLFGGFTGAPAFLYTIDVSPGGLTAQSHMDILNEYPATQLVAQSHYVFGSEGSLVDVTDPTNPARVGRFAAQGGVWPDVANNRVLYAIPFIGSTGPTLTGFALDTQSVLSRSPLSPIHEFSTRDLVRASTGEFAVIGVNSYGQDPGTLYLLHGVGP